MIQRRWVWAGQAALIALVGFFVWRSLAGQWDAFRGLLGSVDLAVGWIGLAAVVVWITYALLIVAWRTVLGGWGHHLPFPAAARVWCVSNLGRYLPGKLWSIAGMALLARSAGVDAPAATTSALAMQAIAVGTGAAIVAGVLPDAGSGVRLAGAALLAFVSIAALTARPFTRQLGRVTGGRWQLSPLPVAVVVVGLAITGAAWVLYGVAFWLLGRGVTPHDAPSLVMAVGGFAAGYIVGLLSIVTPGGVGVREAVLVGILTPAMGGGAALILSVASRLLLTFTELAAAVVALWFARRYSEEAAGGQI